MGTFDIIIFAAVAAFLGYRIYQILGQKRPDEPERPNPFVKPAEPPASERPTRPADEDDTRLLPGNLSLEEGEEASPARRNPTVGPPPGSLAGTLAEFQKLDSSFSEKTFLQGAKAAFGMIVTAFAKGDTDNLRRLLADRVYFGFVGAIEQRGAAKQTQETEIMGTPSATITAARLEGGKAFITVEFVSQQRNVLRDAAGQVLEGDAKRSEEITDNWTFMRDLREADSNSQGPIWVLVETRA